MSFINNSNNDIQEFVIKKDTILKDGSLLKKGSDFIIDHIKDNNVCMHFPIETKSYFSKGNENNQVYVSISEFFKISKSKNEYEDTADSIFDKLQDAIDENIKLREKVEDLKEASIHEQEWYEVDKYEWEIQKLEAIDEIEHLSTNCDIYKETLYKISDKYDIAHDEIKAIINSIYDNRHQENKSELQRELQ